MSHPIVGAGARGLSIVGTDWGEYDPGDLIELDKAIRHMPQVVEAEQKVAQTVLGLVASENFGVTTQDDPETTRARTYVHPINNQGIHEELTESLLIKAYVNMGGAV